MHFARKFSTLLAAAAMAGSAAHAAPMMQEWVFNPAGQGFESGQMVVEYLDTNGNVFHQVDQAGGGAVSVRQHAVLNIVQADSDGRLFPINYMGGNITGIYEASGVGEPGGSFSYTGGSFRLYQNPAGQQYGTEAGIYGANLGKLIADLTVQSGGGGAIDGLGTPVMNSPVRLFAQAGGGHLQSGYFFDGNGRDLAQAPVVLFELTSVQYPGFGFGRLVDELACQFAGFTGPGCAAGTDFINTPANALLSMNGQLKLTEVPEPGSVALSGLGLFAAAAAGRRRIAPRQAQAAS